jgi:predicted ATP-dependent serine protease
VEPPLPSGWGSARVVESGILTRKKLSIRGGIKSLPRGRAKRISDEDIGQSPCRRLSRGRTQRLVTPDQELNRVLGGGIVAGSLVLIGGQPGIGKSTLLLQVALQTGAKVLYVSGEESEEQIKMRARPLAGR